MVGRDADSIDSITIPDVCTLNRRPAVSGSYSGARLFNFVFQNMRVDHVQDYTRHVILAFESESDVPVLMPLRHGEFWVYLCGMLSVTELCQACVCSRGISKCACVRVCVYYACVYPERVCVTHAWVGCVGSGPRRVAVRGARVAEQCVCAPLMDGCRVAREGVSLRR